VRCAKKSLKPLFWEFNSFEVIDVDIARKLLLVIVMISSMFVHICSRFHDRRDNSVKTTFLVGTPLSRPSLRGTPQPAA